MGNKELRKNRYVLGAGLILLVLLANLIRFSYPVYKSHYNDYRNKGVFIVSYYNYFVVPNSIVVDLWHVSPDKSMADITRNLLQLAESLKGREFNKVYIAYRGERKFYFKGDYFHNLGAEYNYQNPVYTIRTMPQNVYNLNGEPAFGAWQGGLLGVLKGQLDDSKRFHEEWYLKDLRF